MGKQILRQLKNLPQKPGVYFFKDSSGKILYVGKARNFKKRIYSYFSRRPDFTSGVGIPTKSSGQNPKDLGARLEKMIEEVAKINFVQTDSEIEALLLEAELVKRYQPKYNVRLKDDKGYLYLGITKNEDFARVFFARKPDLVKIKAEYFGPYTSADSLRKAIKFLRRIFPIRTCRKMPKKVCLWYHISRCGGPCEGKISKTEYKKIIRELKQFLKGRKKNLQKTIESQMKAVAKSKDFEKAAILRDRLFALKHLDKVWMATRQVKEKIPKRIECYDISNIMGNEATGSMVVFADGQANKNQYRRFKIRTVRGISDTEMLAEVLERRFKRDDWPLPNLIIIDGGVGQLNVARKIVLEKSNLNIPIVAIAKGRKAALRPEGRGRKKDRLFFAGKKVLTDKKLIQQIRDEAHRFAIKYHRLLRSKKVLGD